MEQEYFFSHVCKDDSNWIKAKHVVLGSEGCIWEATSKKMMERIRIASSQGKSIRYLTPIIPDDSIEKIVDVIKSLPPNSKVTFNDWGLFQRFQNDFFKGNGIIPVLGRILTRSLSDCPWSEEIIGAESEENKELLRLNNFVHTSKLEFLHKYNVQEIEVNQIDLKSLLYLHSFGIKVTVYNSYYLLSVGRICFHAKLNNFSPRAICRYAEDCVSKVYDVKMIQKFSRSSKMLCDLDASNLTDFSGIRLCGNILYKKMELKKDLIIDNVINMDGFSN